MSGEEVEFTCPKCGKVAELRSGYETSVICSDCGETKIIMNFLSNGDIETVTSDTGEYYELEPSVRSALKAVDEATDDLAKVDALSLLSEFFTYDNILTKAEKKIPIDGFESKDAFISWAKVNVKTAIFASVAYRWIESYIKQELGHHRSTVRFLKTKEDKENPNSVGNYVISLDSINPYTDDNYSDNLLEGITQEEFIIEDERIVNEERNEYFKDVIDRALSGLSLLDRRIIKKKFGIGFPNELSNNEIAESEGLSLSDVKNSINKSLKYIADEIPDNVKENIIELFS